MARRKYRFYCPDPEEHFTGVRRNGGRGAWEYTVPPKVYPDKHPVLSKVVPEWFVPTEGFGALTDTRYRTAHFSSDDHGLIDVSWDGRERQLSIGCERRMLLLYRQMRRAGYRVALRDGSRRRFYCYPPVPKPKGTHPFSDQESE